MWPDTPQFSSPYFVDYGQDPGAAGNPLWPDGADRYVYAVSADGRWDRAGNLYLGRVRRDRIGNLDAADWSFVTGWAAGRPTWGPAADAVPVLGTLHGDPVGRELGWTSVQWVAPIHKYLLVEWYYPHHSETHTTDWVFYQADHVWGPYTPFGDVTTWAPGNPSDLTHGDYTPVVPTAFMDTRLDRSVYPYRLGAWILTTGDFDNADLYRLTAVPLTLQVTDSARAELVAVLGMRPQAVVVGAVGMERTAGPARVPTPPAPAAAPAKSPEAPGAEPAPRAPADALPDWPDGFPDPLGGGWGLRP